MGILRGVLLAVLISATVGANVATAEEPPRDAGPWTPTTFDGADPKLPTLVIVGDSTAATGGTTTRGWGAVLIDYFDPAKVNLVNAAVGGRSFRTFTSEGRWDRVVEHLKPGDFVIIELGHNDGGGAKSRTGRGDVPGIGDETETVTRRDGSTEVVHTYGWYTRKYIREAREKGATPIVSTTTVRNIWRDGRVERGMGRMLYWAKQVAEEEKALFVDHSNITADFYEALGPEAVANFFPQDHTHTSTDGAILNAETFLAGRWMLDGKPLDAFLNAKGGAIPPYVAPGADWVGYHDPSAARLGIALGSAGPRGVAVSDVHPGTAAEKSGLVQGDVITRIGDVFLTDVESLLKELAKAKVGDSVVLGVRRKGEILSIDVSVTFGAWNEQNVSGGDATSASTTTTSGAEPGGEGQRRDAPYGLDRRGRPLKYPPGVEPGMPHPDYNSELPTLWLVGDSTVKEGRDTGLNGGRWGWGHEIGRYFDLKRINVENQALGGTSSRSFRTGGWWESVREMIRPGDFVMIQFGHNDGGLGAREPRIKARGTLRGAGDETAEGAGEDGKSETVHTYGWYVRQYVADVRAAGATPIVCSLIPRNGWRDGKMGRGEDDSYTGWARDAAAQEKAAFINLNHIICDAADAMGEDFARTALFRKDDGTHTNLLGAQVNAQCVISGVKALAAASDEPFKLAEYLSPVAESIPKTASENVASGARVD